jgi:WD40 repeat protein
MCPDMNLSSVEVEALPACLAVPLQALVREQHPIIQLWKICDTAELLLRMLVALQASELEGALSDATAKKVIPLIEKPTLFGWLEVAQALSAVPRVHLIPELPASLDTIITSWIKGSYHNDLSRSVLSLRNQLAHGANFSSSLATSLLPKHLNQTFQVFHQLDWLTGVHLSVLYDNTVRSLRGPDPECWKAVLVSSSTQQALQRFVGGIVLEYQNRATNLWPMQIFGIPGHTKKGHIHQSDAPSLMMYSKREKKRLELSALLSEIPSVSINGPALERLKTLFRLHDKAQLMGESEDSFDRELKEEADGLIDREEDSKCILALIKGTSERVLWVHGLPGRGKSALMAKVATQLRLEVSSSTQIAYRFRAGDPRGTRLAFLRYSIACLSGDNTGKTISQLEQHLQELLQKSQHRVVFLLDGLDEIERIDPGFGNIVFRLSSEDVLWVCAGRFEAPLQVIFRAERCHHVFGVDGLQPLSGAAINDWLKRDAPPAQRDRIIETEQDGETSSWVQKVIKRSEGLPAYLTLLLDDLRSGTVQVGSVIPNGLTAYFNNLLEQGGIDDAAAVLPVIMSALVLSVEALDTGSIKETLKLSGRLSEESKEKHIDIVSEAIHRAKSMLKLVPTRHGTEGYIPYHDALSTHLLNHVNLVDARAAARKGLVALAQSPEKLEDINAQKHSLNTGVRQLLALGETEKAIELLARFEYLMARLQLLGGQNVFSLMEDYLRIPEPALQQVSSFISLKAHQLARGDELDLFQLAMSAPKPSFIAKAAEQFRSRNLVQKPWLRSINNSPESDCLRTLEGHTNWVSDVIFAPGDKLISASQDNTIKIWEQQTGKCLMSIDAHAKGVCSIGLLSGDRLVSAGWDGYIKVWSLLDGACLAMKHAHKEGVCALVVSDDESFIVSGGEDKTIKFWSLDLVCAKTMIGHTEGVCSVAISPDGKRIFSAARNKTIKQWELGSGRFAGNVPVLGSGVFTPSVTHKYLFVGGQDETIKVCELLSGACTNTLKGHRGKVTRIAIGADKMVSGSLDKMICLWDLKDLSLIKTFAGHAGGVCSVALHPTEPLAASASMDHSIKLWSLVAAGSSSGQICHSGSIEVLCHNETQVISTSRDASLCLWDPQTGLCTRAFSGHQETVSCVEISANGQCALSGSYDKTLRLWDMSTGNCIRVIKGHSGHVLSVVLHRDGERAISCGTDETIRVWRLNNGNCEHVLRGHNGFVRAIALHSDGERLLSTGDDGTIKLWSLQSGQCLSSVKLHTSPAKKLVIYGDDVFCGGLHVYHWNIKTGENKMIEEHASPILALMLSPDGSQLFSASAERLVVRNLTGSLRSIDLPGHGGACSLSVSGCLLLSGGTDKILRLWNRTTGEQIAHWSAESNIEDCKMLSERLLVFGDAVGQLTFLSLEGPHWPQL